MLWLDGERYSFSNPPEYNRQLPNSTINMDHKLNADELFKIVVDTSVAFPLNLDFILADSTTTNLPGQGIFFLYYKEELVYIGYFDPSEANRDVRLERMKKELATITMRGIQVTMNKVSNTALDKSLNLNTIRRKTQGDFLTSRKRVEFADINWDAFKTDDFLCDFTFYWFPEEKNLGNAQDELEHLTNQLRIFYKPTCNG